MRSIMLVAATLFVSACATQTPTPEKAASAAEEKKTEAKSAPQCWSGDAGKFLDVGNKTSIAGVNVECKLTTDGKSAQWVGAKH